MKYVWQSCKVCKKSIDTRALIPFVDKEDDSTLLSYVCEDCRPDFVSYLDEDHPDYDDGRYDNIDIE